MLGDTTAELILEKVREKLRTYPFPIAAGDVGIMGGDQEGVYAWITINYLLGRIGLETDLQTVGIMDLGGGSTQIVFEPASGLVMPPGAHNYKLEFHNKKYNIYQHSFDGYGLMQARKNIANESLNRKTTSCVPKEMFFQNEQSTDFSHCTNFIREIMFNKTTCATLQTCSFDGIYMPLIPQSNEIYAFSYFYDKFADPFTKILGFEVGDLKTLATNVCVPDTPSSQEKLPESARKEFIKNKDWCGDLAFMVLHVLI